MKHLISVIVIGASLLGGCQHRPDLARDKFADVHIHYNWDHAEYISPQEVVEILQQHAVDFAVVSGIPADHAQLLAAAAPDWIIPIYSPYYQAGNRLDWFFDADVVTQTRQALASGRYHGIGEVHLVAGVGPRRDNPVFLGLLQLAREFGVPFLIHTDASSPQYMQDICVSNPDIRFQWAHAGGVLRPDQLDTVMQACPNLWVDLSARDPWHYGGLLDKHARLPEDWRNWIIRFQDRIMLGTDPMWNAQQTYRWYEADQGWQHYTQLQHYHHDWLQQLPAAVASKLRLLNARRFYHAQLQRAN